MLASWFEREWAAYYRPGGANAEADLLAYCNVRNLPIGIVALHEQELCGAAALKAEPLPELPHLTPWAGAGLVPPSLRRQGIGAKLVGGLEALASELGFKRIYCATGTSANLLERRAWSFLERVNHGGELLSVYEKAL
jgi:GNAT superfamily N-acetyltransferase